MEAEKKGFLKKYKVELIGANSKAISNAEDRQKFRKNMIDINLDLPKSKVVKNISEADKALKKIGLPLIIRPSFTLGGLGGGIAKNKKANILVTQDPKEAASGASVIMTDKWISMGDMVNKKKKKKLLQPYQVNKKIMKLAKTDAIFMHCLPASRGEEVTNEVMDGKQSAVWLASLNRIHIQKSIIEWCLK
jgi:aspartate carbamoyltransferase catalytic subunit